MGYLIIIAIFIQGFQLANIRLVGFKRKNNILCTLLLVLIIISPLVYVAMNRSMDVGSDTFNVYYRIYYLGYTIFHWHTSWYEFLFVDLLKICNFIVPNFQFALGTIASIISVIYVYYFIKNKINLNIMLALLGFFIWIWIPSLNISRQILAVSILFLGIEFLKKDKINIFVVFWLISIFIHISAIIGGIYLILYYCKELDSKKIPIMFSLGSVIGLLLVNLIIKIPIFSKFQTQLGSFTISNINFKFFLLPLMILPFIVLNWDKISKEKYGYILLTSYLLIFPSILLSGYMWFAFRIMYFFIPSEIILIARIGKYYESSISRALVNLILIILLIGSFYLYYVVWHVDGVVPYQFYN